MLSLLQSRVRFRRMSSRFLQFVVGVVQNFFLNFSDANFEKTRKLQMVAHTAAAN